MNPAEAAVLLAAISANDNREVTEAGSRAWAASLPDVELGDALECLPKFYRAATRDSKNWIYPGDVLEGVRELHRHRRIDAINAAEQQAIEAAEERLSIGNGDDDISPADVELIGRRARRDAMRSYAEQHATCAVCAELARVAESDRRRQTEAWQR